MEIALCHPSGAYNFEVGKLCTPAFKVFSLGFHTENPAIAPHFETFREVHFFKTWQVCTRTYGTDRKILSNPVSRTLRDFRHGNGRSRFALHLLENGQDIGSMEDIMDTIHITDKGRLMDTLEKFYIRYSARRN
jgi:hypothetical protein